MLEWGVSGCPSKRQHIMLRTGSALFVCWEELKWATPLLFFFLFFVVVLIQNTQEFKRTLFNNTEQDKCSFKVLCVLDLFFRMLAGCQLRFRFFLFLFWSSWGIARFIILSSLLLSSIYTFSVLLAIKGLFFKMKTWASPSGTVFRDEVQKRLGTS